MDITAEGQRLAGPDPGQPPTRLGERVLSVDQAAECLFTDNETNPAGSSAGTTERRM